MDGLAIPYLSSACCDLSRDHDLSAWYGHIPFAFWIISLLKPRTIVELGTHNGISYSAFCEAIKKNDLTTRAYAVDTWKGDDQAGFYDDEVYLKFKKYHDQHYSQFSTLMRMTFDEGVHQFSDGSIDLLHIDGLHTYEAVKHDFEMWLPKLSKKGVVLFHDTCVKENNFGVYQLWEELLTQYPGFNFTHSHGLGVLLVGKEREPFLKKIAEIEKENFHTSSFNRLFQKLGMNYELTYSLHKNQLELEEQKRIAEESSNLAQSQTIILHEIEKQLRQKEEEFLQQEKLTEQQRDLVLEKEDQLQKQIAIIAEKNASLTEKENLLHQKDILLAGKERQLVESDQLIFKIKNNKSLQYNLKVLNLIERLKTPFERHLIAYLIGRSNLFDRQWYLEKNPDVKNARVDPILHYINSGAAEGRNPGPLFHTNWYLEQNVDVKSAKVNPFVHFILHGMYEGRAPNSHVDVASYLQENNDLKRSEFSPVVHFMRRGKHDKKEKDCQRISNFLKANLPFPKDKQVILVFGHEALRTGAPIALLGIIRHLSQDPKLHLITILKRGGPLLPDYQRVCQTLVLGDPSGKTFTSSAVNTKYFEWIAEHLASSKHKVTCLCSTVDSKETVAVFGRRGFNIVSLIYEMPASINKWFGGAATMKIFDQYSQRLIFPSSLTYKQAFEEYKIDEKKTCIIHPCVSFAYPKTERLLLREKFLNEIKLPNNTILIVGCGAYDHRKGFDLFIQAGEKSILGSMQRNQPIPIFLWVGTYFGCDYAMNQIATIPKNIRKYFIFLNERPNVEEVIAAADVFFLSSREDPFPLVALIAAGYNVPIVLFSGATGVEGVFPPESYYEANNFDINSACAVLAKAIHQIDFQGCSSFVREEFSFKKYAKKIASELASSRLASAVDLADSPPLKVIPYLSKGMKCFARMSKLLPHKTRNVIKSIPLVQNIVEKVIPEKGWSWPCDYGKKPIPGFHPGIYKEDCMSPEDRTDPFHHFLQAGKPKGRWNVNLLSSKIKKERTIPSSLRIGLHIHVFYEDLFMEIMDRLELNQVKPDLLITIANSIQDTRAIVEKLRGYQAKVEIRIVKNKGRDIGAFLTEFGTSLIAQYDIIGHLHTKKSVHVADSIAKEWREFLLENLLGGRLPMADIIVEALAEDEKIGLVFPSDPYTNAWDQNRAIGKELLLRLGIDKFYEQFNFPVGTMFWARTVALKPLLDLKLTYQDYPEEPLPIDGTILHALERIIPFVVEKEGYQIEMTHVEGITR